MKNIKFYKNNVSPIEEIEIDEISEGELFITSTGNRFRKINDEEFIMDKQSALVEDEYVEDLTEKQLKLYWSIMKNS